MNEDYARLLHSLFHDRIIVALIGLGIGMYGVFGLLIRATNLMPGPSPVRCLLYIAVGAIVCAVYRLFLQR